MIGRIVCIRNACLILLGDSFIKRTIVHKLDGMDIAVIVEFCVVVARPVLCAIGCIFRKAGQIIEVLVGYCESRSNGGVFMMQLICAATDGHISGFSLQNFHIVVCC